MMMNSRALRLTEEELHTMRSLHEREFSELSTNEKLEYIEELLEEEKRGLQGKEITEEIKEEIRKINCLKYRILPSKRSL